MAQERCTPHPTQLTLSVVTPVHNGGENFCRCLAALAQTQPPPDEIIVVADGSSDSSAELAKSSGARVIRLPERCGPAHARNVGARAASSDLIFFIDADVEVYPDAIAQATSLFEQAPALAAAFGSYDGAPAAPNFLSQYKNLLHHYIHQISNEHASTFWSGCGLIRREVFLSIGGFDESYRRPAIEDIELGYRLRQAGHTIRLCKTLQVKHLKQWNLVSLLQADFLYRAIPWTELIWRDHRFINDLNLQYSSRISVILLYGLLLALAVAWRQPASLIVGAAAGLLLLSLNARLYRFFWRQRGAWFVLQTIPWHWFYYAYSGLAFLVGTLRYLSSELKSARLRLPEEQEGLLYAGEGHKTP